MVDKITLSNISDLTQTTSAQTTINSNSTTIQAAFDNTLSRDGTSPNQMSSNLDMNSNQIINLPSPGTSLSPVRLIDVTPGGPPSPSIITGNNVYSGNNSFTGTNTFGTNPTTFTGDAYFKSGDPWLDVKAFGATGNGSTDDTAAIQAAINAAAGKPVFLPAGTYVVSSQLHYITNSNFTSGLRLFGAGQELTFIDNRCTGGVSCIFSSGSSNAFQLGGYIRDLTIKTTTASGSPGIDLRAVYQYSVENVHIIGLAGNGAQITCTLGDLDAANNIRFKNCRFENCGNAGLLCNFGSGLVQPSFIRVEDCFFNSNTLAGYYFIGLQGVLINCAFTTNTGPGLWIPYNNANNAQFFAAGNTFENNNSGGPQVRIDSLQGGEFVGTEIAATVVPSNVGFSLGQTGQQVSATRIEGTRVRISNAYAYTMFNLAASATINVISNTFWQNWTDVSQTRYLVNASAYGNRISDTFDAVQVGASNGVTGLSLVNAANENVALPQDGVFYLTSGPTGAFNIGGFTNGYDGRKLELHNNTGQTMTINYEDASSSPANRIRTNGTANVTVNNLGTVSFRYNANFSRWVCLGVG